MVSSQFLLNAESAGFSLSSGSHTFLVGMIITLVPVAEGRRKGAHSTCTLIVSLMSISVTLPRVNRFFPRGRCLPPIMLCVNDEEGARDAFGRQQSIYKIVDGRFSRVSIERGSTVFHSVL